MDYDDVIYNQPLNEFLSNRIEPVQYKVALASLEPYKAYLKKIYQELGLEHLHQRRWMRQLFIL